MGRRYSQVFLVKYKIAKNIVDSMNLKKGEWVIEVGPGKGILTKELLSRNVKVVAIEVDRKLCQFLRENIIDLDFFLEENDVLKVDFYELFKKYKIKKAKLVSNLPYHITTPFLEKIIKERYLFEEIYLTLQKEVVDRITSLPKNKTYGSLTIFINYFMEVEVLFPIPRFFFRPIPSVSSIFIKLKPREKNYPLVYDEEIFFKLVRKVFSQRRKKIKNILKEFLDENSLSELSKSYDLSQRGENLTPEDFAFISDFIYKKRNEKR
ncbi:MAG: 16S rRNA (adenine(1518)-N(6)/adenine(1519)-N(6))-dimethyltransferase RsmA [candidate division WOR-3 bacterium]